MPNLNETQKKIIEGYLLLQLEDIAQRLKDEMEPISLTTLAYKGMINPVVLPHLCNANGKIFLEKGIFSSIKEIHKLFHHPYPQNRSVGDPSAASGHADGLIDAEVYYWENGFGSTIKHEPQGLLSLTSRDDSTALPVTKDAVITYVTQLINQQAKLHEILGVYTTAFNKLPFASSDKDMVISKIFEHERIAVTYFHTIYLIKNSPLFTSANIKLLTDNIRYCYSVLQVMTSLKEQNILNPENFKKLMNYPQFANKIICASLGTKLTQEKFDEVIEKARQEMHIAMLMGTHPKIGAGSTINAITRSNSNSESTSSNNHLLQEVFKYV